MDRHIVYPGAIPLDTDILKAIKDGYYGVGWLSESIIGTNAVCSGLGVTPTSPASLQVNVAPGAIYSLQTVDVSAYGSLGTDANQFTKQGILASAATLTLTPPGTVGQSINYLVQIAFSEVDGTPVVLPYYNSANPSVAWSGPNNSGTPQNTVRKDTCVVQLKAGTPAASGSQTTPAPDAGFTGIYVITVANGQTTITSGNISLLATAPFFTPLPQVPAAVQNSQWTYAIAGGTANALTATLFPALLAYVAGVTLQVKLTANNTGAATINVNGLGAKSITLPNGNALVSGDLLSGSIVMLQYDGTNFQVLSVVASEVSAGYIAAGRPPQTAPYFIANGSAGGATYANNVASVSTDLAIASSNFLDAGTTLSGGILTIGAKDAGVWQFSTNLGINTNFNGWISKVSMQKNGSGNFAYAEPIVSGTAGTGNTTVSGTINLAAGDTVRPLMLQNTGSSQTSSITGHFSGSRVGV